MSRIDPPDSEAAAEGSTTPPGPSSAALSRRALLSAGAALPAAMAASGGHAAPPGHAAEVMTAMADSHSPAAGTTAAPLALEGLETLTAVEADTLEAVCARLVPTDDKGPGAKEARAAHYIDRALAGPIRHLRDTYAAGLSALDAYARSSKGKAFVQLEPAAQDAVLSDLEANVASGFTPDASSFFGLMRTHTIEGMFCDPYYGGNAHFVGWDLIGYPGLRMAVTAQDQRLVKPATVRASAYDGGMFGRGAGQ
jgi:gluconate 2-dehydrogenase gamma chain